jgi:hypothetical protein
MARKPTIKAAEPAIEKGVPEGHKEHVEIASELAVITQGYADERDLLNQLLGQAQMADAFGKFSQTVWSSKLAYVKENKLYRGLSGKKNPNGLELTGTWIEFCNLLGISDEKANQDIENLRNFGEEALESMGRMGIGYREMRQYRKLPEDDKSALLEVAKSGDKDAFIDLAETLVAKHVKERADLQAKIADSEADHKATEKMLVGRTESLTETLTQVQKDLEKLQLRTAPWDERVATFKEEITQRQSIIDESVARHFQAVEALDTWVNIELANAPDYDPEAPANMPVEVLTVLLHLSDAIDRTVSLVANAQYELRNRFSGDIDAARQQLLDA